MRWTACRPSSDPASAAQQQKTRQQGLFVGLITLPMRFIGVLLG